MTIITNQVDNCTLKDLNPGDVFLYNGNYYIFIETPLNVHNAVNLVTGKVFLWNLDIKISKLPTAALKIL